MFRNVLMLWRWVRCQNVNVETVPLQCALFNVHYKEQRRDKVPSVRNVIDRFYVCLTPTEPTPTNTTTKQKNKKWLNLKSKISTTRLQRGRKASNYIRARVRIELTSNRIMSGSWPTHRRVFYSHLPPWKHLFFVSFGVFSRTLLKGSGLMIEMSFFDLIKAKKGDTVVVQR